MKAFAFVSEKAWHNSIFDSLNARKNERWYRIDKKDDLNLELLHIRNIEKVFIPHWSYLIPAEIWSNFECIVFHMTDLPYGRGGSPLQNLIVRGHEETKITALRVNEVLDAGDIYLKRHLSLEGSAREIFHRTVPVIKEMIETIIDQEITPKPQSGDPVIFKRRIPRDGDLSDLQDAGKVYDYIRMLDADGYPAAFIETKYFRFEFTKASISDNNEVLANVRIIQK